MRILLYTRRGCHLCEEAEDLLTAFGVGAARVDVDDRPEDAARYGLRVPVLEVDGVVVLEGRLHAPQLAALVAARPGLTGPVAYPGGPAARPAAGPT